MGPLLIKPAEMMLFYTGADTPVPAASSNVHQGLSQGVLILRAYDDDHNKNA